MNDSRWISVKDRLPDEGARVMVYYDDYVYMGTLYKGSFCKADDYLEMEIDNVTHWQPLPSPPEDL